MTIAYFILKLPHLAKVTGATFITRILSSLIKVKMFHNLFVTFIILIFGCTCVPSITTTLKIEYIFNSLLDITDDTKATSIIPIPYT